MKTDRLKYHESIRLSGWHDTFIAPIGTDRNIISILQYVADNQTSIGFVMLDPNAKRSYHPQEDGYVHHKGFLARSSYLSNIIGIAGTSFSRSGEPIDLSLIVALRSGQVTTCDKEGWWYWCPEIITPSTKREKYKYPSAEYQPAPNFQDWCMNDWRVELGGRFNERSPTS